MAHTNMSRHKRDKPHKKPTPPSVHSASVADESDLDAIKDTLQPQADIYNDTTTIKYRYVKAPPRQAGTSSEDLKPRTFTSEPQPETDRVPSQTTPRSRGESFSAINDIQGRARDIQARSAELQRRTSYVGPMRTQTSREKDEHGQPDVSRHDVRRIAREEVRSYHDAEQRMNDHSLAYRYGRFVPFDGVDLDHSRAQPNSTSDTNATVAPSAKASLPKQNQESQPTASREPRSDRQTIVEIQSSRTADASRADTSIVARPGTSAPATNQTRKDVTWAESFQASEPDAHVPREKPSQPAPSNTAKPTPDLRVPNQTSPPRGFKKAHWEEEVDESLKQPYLSSGPSREYHGDLTVEERTYSQAEHGRRNSFETDRTVQPQSSISQRPVPSEYFYESFDRRPASRTQYVDQRTADGAPRQSTAPLSTTAGPPQSGTSAAPSAQRNTPVSSTAQFQAQGVWDGIHSPTDYGNTSPGRPRSPPMDRRTSERNRTYRESISPWRDRIVRERVISSQSSPERGVQSAQHRYRSPDRARQSRDDRGRAKTREKDEKPSKRLRSILRSPSGSPWEDHRTGTRGRSVSFSKHVEVDVLSPPHTSSEVSRVTEDMSRLDASGRRYRGGYADEKYFYENTRRPEPTRKSSDSDKDLEYRRRAMARALSESPSREKGLKMMRGESPEPRRREKEGRPSEYPPSPGKGTSRENAAQPADPRIKASQANNAGGRGRYPPGPSTRGGAANERIEPYMSGALTDARPHDKQSQSRKDDRERRDRRESESDRDLVRSKDDRTLPQSEGARRSEAPITRSETKRQVVIESNGQRKLVNVVKEGRDEHGRWVEVEETAVAPEQRDDRRGGGGGRARDEGSDWKPRRTEHRY